MWYRVKISATHKTSGQRQECDRRLIADHQQGAESMGLQLLGVNASQWDIHHCTATPEQQQRAA